ncbi:unnamed protein product, partial [Meganyctiphanes norvegica]
MSHSYVPPQHSSTKVLKRMRIQNLSKSATQDDGELPVAVRQDGNKTLNERSPSLSRSENENGKSASAVTAIPCIKVRYGENEPKRTIIYSQMVKKILNKTSEPSKKILLKIPKPSQNGSSNSVKIALASSPNARTIIPIENIPNSSGFIRISSMSPNLGVTETIETNMANEYAIESGSDVITSGSRKKAAITNTVSKINLPSNKNVIRNITCTTTNSNELGNTRVVNNTYTETEATTEDMIDSHPVNITMVQAPRKRNEMQQLRHEQRSTPSSVDAGIISKIKNHIK